MVLDLKSPKSVKRILTRRSPISALNFLLLVAFILPALACTFIWVEEEPEQLYVPEAPTQYTAETAPVEVYVPLDEAGNVVPGDSPYAYYATAKLVYVLRFWDVGLRMDGYEKATISRVYTPISIGEIHPDLEDTLSGAEQSAILSRSSFPTSEVLVHELEFQGGITGQFVGTNSVTGEQILGHLQWEDEDYEIGTVHVIFTEDIQQDYVVLGDEVFYNWP